MGSFLAKPVAVFDALVASVRYDWVPWVVAGALIAFACICYSMLVLAVTSWRLARLRRETREHAEEEARNAVEYRQEVIERLRATHYYLRELSEKLGSSLPQEVKVGLIQAENLVVQPPIQNGRAREPDFR
jgi:hypothetical protein